MALEGLARESMVIDGVTLYSDNNSYTDSAVLKIDEAIATGVTDEEIAMVLDVSEISMIFMISDQDISVQTNNGGAPDETFTLTANIPHLWHTDNIMAASNPWATDVTALFITNASGSTANFELVALYDSTPP